MMGTQIWRQNKLVVEWMAHQNVDLNSEVYPQYAALKTACDFDDDEYKILKQLITDGIDINSHGYDGETVLITYCFENNKEIAEILLQLGADINAVDVHDRTALMYACINGHADIVELLIGEGCNVVHMDQFGCTALDYLWFSDYRNDISDIIMKCNSSNVRIDKNNEHMEVLFRVLCGRGCDFIVALLLEAGVDANTSGFSGGTGLLEACENGHKNVVELLLKHNVNFEMRSSIGFTALMKASAKGHTEIVQLLLRKGAKIDSKDDYGNTAFIFACYYENNNVAELLLDYGANINMIKRDGKTALMQACEFNQKQMVVWLIEHGADINIADENGRTPLMYSCWILEPNISRLLIQDGNVNKKDMTGKSALMYACKYGSYEIVKLLIENDADVHARDNSSMTVLMHTCCGISRDLENQLHSSLVGTFKRRYQMKGQIVDLLLNQEIEVDHQDINGFSAVMHAAFSSVDVCLKKLIDAASRIDLVENFKNRNALSIALQRFDSDQTIIILHSSGQLTENMRLKTFYRYPPHECGIDDIGGLRTLMELKIFEWELCRDMNIDVFERVIIAGLSFGICPGKLIHSNEYNSPLIIACRLEALNLIHIIVDNLYFYPEDCLTLCSYKLLSSPFVSSLIYELTHNPLSLFKCTFIAISKIISSNVSPCLRKSRVDMLCIPDTMKKALNFEMATIYSNETELLYDSDEVIV